MSIRQDTRYTNEEIKVIRNKAGMTQSVLANYMGVSKKTVEAWELGRTHPTGPACRLLNILDQGKEHELSFVSVKTKD
ncbi:helix-turn-helix domain-containing protein [Butyrivibrio sp. AC2005]|uniref:helix-turn-helix domain-containing protein n=1 Tax=Butyrivibrio sp. AC2005 TaxID=1280672 RepID=UPI0009DBBC4B|nr:helix-turn-helix domain-containing protein [Butyrivibrio sp. AC2005]